MWSVYWYKKLPDIYCDSSILHSYGKGCCCVLGLHNNGTVSDCMSFSSLSCIHPWLCSCALPWISIPLVLVMEIAF